MSGPKKLGWLAAGGAAGAAGRSRWWGLRFPRWRQWVRRCAGPRQTQWSGLQGRAVCGSRWRTQRGHAVAGGRWYLWTDGGVEGWGLAARACWWASVRCLWCPCVPCQYCARCMVCRRGGGPVMVCHGVGSHGWWNRPLRRWAWSVWGRVAACCRYLWVRYVSCSAVLATAVRCICAAVAWGSSA